MCQFKSGIIFKNRIVLTPEGNESHSDLLESLDIEDTRENAMRMFVRAELLPKDNNKASDIKDWTFKVDQDITPEWYDSDPGRYEEEFRNEVKEYLKDKIINVIAGYAWDKVTDGNLTYYFMNGFYKNMEFGKTNNYSESYIREELNNSNLAKKLKEKFGEKLVPISLDLLSLDGLDDYGLVKGDALAIPNIDIYRKFRKNITKLDRWWWLATPDSTPSGYGSVNVQCVRSDALVCCCWCGFNRGVRPFFIVQS